MSQSVNITNIFIATWDNVGYYSRRTDKVRIVCTCIFTLYLTTFIRSHATVLAGMHSDLKYRNLLLVSCGNHYSIQVGETISAGPDLAL